MEESIKKPRMTEADNNDKDIISNLPENIDDRERFSLKTARKTSFVNFVDRIFILSRPLQLKRVRLLCRQKYGERRMMTWISAALMRNVEDLEIVYECKGGVIPRCLFECRPLSKLKLQLPSTFRPVQNWFSNLKVLHLATVRILNEHDTSQLKFSFPVLETLELIDCTWSKVNFVEINAPALTELKVSQCSRVFGADHCHIKISGAKLQKMGFHYYFGANFELSESSVFSAIVDRRHYEISQSKQGPPLPIFNLLKRLECTILVIEAFLEFLHLAPFLEWIKLDVRDLHFYDYDSVESIPSCIVSHLKEVEFCGFKGERPHVRLADFLLKNAVELKKMSGLSRKRSVEGQEGIGFWANLRKVFRDGDFKVDSWVKNMDDFKRFLVLSVDVLVY
ncbi:F-box/FBD/LRR-repeat protein At5g56420-like [Henckelia pumila]|uniref:F-box/FBD/LRR-repeat protein At5g56420-like n=1 Tax=Henckelia pumila TaxID=405737 RepID=UPI003C6E1117